MSVNGINAYNATTSTKKVQEKTKESEVVIRTEEELSGFSKDAVVYKPSAEGLKKQEEAAHGKVTTKTSKEERQAIIEQMKADAQAQQDSLMNMVREALGQQAGQFGIANDDDSIWKFLADGNYTVSEAAKAKAQEAISEDGYWGVEQTSTRIVDFAKALAGNDPAKADKLLAAFKKGYDEATKAWGKELPEISKKTYAAVEQKFAEWKNSVEE